MYDDRGLRFTHWAAGQGFDPLGHIAALYSSFILVVCRLKLKCIKGYRTCFASVLNHTGKATVFQDRTISDMFSPMELQRPRIAPVLPQWDRALCQRLLSKPPYEPLRKGSLKHLSLKTVFLLAMASAGRHSELQALVFDPKYTGTGVTLYFSPKFMRKIQKPNLLLTAQ